MSSKVLFEGFVELLNGGGVVPVEIQDQDGYTCIWVDGNLADDVESPEDFESSYGIGLYNSLKEYRAFDGAPHDIYDFWPEVKKES